MAGSHSQEKQGAWLSQAKRTLIGETESLLAQAERTLQEMNSYVTLTDRTYPGPLYDI